MINAGKTPGIQTHQVFISYASDNGNSATSDRQVADQICSALESYGIGCWVAHRDILPGDDWMEAIIDGVDQAKIIVLVFSDHTEKSKWVKDEIKLALEEDKTIIPFRIRDVYPMRALKLLKVRCQWMDAFTPPQGNHIERLVGIVSSHLGLKPSSDPPDMPEDVKKVVPKAHSVEKNKNGYWEAYYKEYDISMVYIPPGEFTMGQTAEEKKWLIDQIGEKDYNSYYRNETPLHNVYLDAYWMGKTEVTVKQYMKFVNDAKSHYPQWLEKGSNYNIETGSDDYYKKFGSALKGDNYPIVGISWDDAVAYCKWLSDKKKLNFKLPSEAQWERAARGTEGYKYPWGNNEPDKNLANFNRNVGKTSPVGSYLKGASPYGLLDMAGNVWEWCSDWYKSDYYKDSPKENPTGAKSGADRVVRGGSWYDVARNLRCADRDGVRPADRDGNIGFRLSQDN